MGIILRQHASTLIDIQMDKGSSDRMFSEMIEKHYEFLYRYAFRLTGCVVDAEDLTQQTYLAVQTKLHQLREHSHARAWLCAIIRNAHFKSRRGQVRRFQSLERIPEPFDVSRDDLAIDGEKLQKALNEIPDEFRIPLILFYFDEFSYKEIAEQMDVPIGTIMSRLARGKDYLRSRLLGSVEDSAVRSESTIVKT